jgi:hypothetical protein
MSHLNILTISKEIENINRNVSKFQSQINTIETENSKLNNNFNDINEIKINKIDVVHSLDEIKSDFKFLENKINSIDGCVKKLLSRNVDFVNKNTQTLFNFLKKKIEFNEKKINVLLYVFDCTTLQDCLLLNDRELIDFGFSQSEVSLLKRLCKETLENNTFQEYSEFGNNIAINSDGIAYVSSLNANEGITLNNVVGL